MPTVTITLTDTPAGGVAIHTDFKPAIGAPCSAAQAAALDIITTTKRQWSGTTPLRPGSEDALRFPSLVGDHLHYRGGLVTDKAGNPITQEKSQ